jgi:NAD(P)-dependent dehydrogenase (short-subunit alcohol dehydrogenase family)
MRPTSQRFRLEGSIVDDPTRMFRLDGRTAIITGASSGLGVVMSEALAGAGANVVLAARRTERIEELARSITAAGGKALAVPCDVSREDDVDRMIAATQERFGSVDVLVNNAGVADPKPAEQESGVIVNVASVLGVVGAGQIPQASYTASKGGVVNLTRELAAQWARRGIRVNAILPGWFPSEMTAGMFDNDDGKRWIRGRTPMGRAGDPKELNGALLFLASDASTYVTGAMILVDGGWTTV